MLHILIKPGCTIRILSQIIDVHCNHEFQILNLSLDWRPLVYFVIQFHLIPKIVAIAVYLGDRVFMSIFTDKTNLYVHSYALFVSLSPWRCKPTWCVCKHMPGIVNWWWSMTVLLSLGLMSCFCLQGVSHMYLTLCRRQN